MAARRWAHIITLYKSPSLSFISCLPLETGKLRVLTLQIRKEQKCLPLRWFSTACVLGQQGTCRKTWMSPLINFKEYIHLSINGHGFCNHTNLVINLILAIDSNHGRVTSPFCDPLFFFHLQFSDNKIVISSLKSQGRKESNGCHPGFPTSKKSLSSSEQGAS